MKSNPYILIRLAGWSSDKLTALSIRDDLEMTEKQWIQIKKIHTNHLLTLSQDPILQNGLLFSSHSLLERIGQLNQKSLNNFRKKENQSLRAITQYLGRIATKTVPFSSFTMISLLNNSQLKLRKQYQLNVSYIHNKAIKSNTLYLNPSISRINRQYFWFSMKALDKIHFIDEELFPEIFQNPEHTPLKTFNQIDLLELITEKFKIQPFMASGFVHELQASEILIPAPISHPLSKDFSEKTLSKLNISKKTMQTLYEKEKSPSFPIEKLIYEHIYQPSSFKIKNNDLEIIKSELFQLYLFLFSFHKIELQEKLQDIWNALDFDVSEVPFTLFYKRFLEKGLAFPLKKIKYDFKIKMQKGQAYLEIDEIAISNPSFGVITQIYKSSGQIRAYLNDFTGGYGKYYGRFLDMLPSEITHYISKTNQSSKFNLVVNPILNPTNIDIAPSTIEKKISWQDLKIVKNGNTIDLYQNDEKLTILDTSLEHPKYKSIRYQLLNLFGFPSISKNNLIQQILKKIEQSKSYGKYTPSIFYENILLQRAQWVIQHTDLVNPNIKSPFQYFTSIQNWRKKLNLPQYCYVKSSDHPKLVEAQYIDFSSPHFVHLFQNISRKITQNLIIEKMIPLPKQALQQDGKSFLSEFLIEFEENLF